MKDEGSSVALPLVLVALFMGAVKAAGFSSSCESSHVGDASSSSATATPTSVLLPPPASSLVASSPTFVTPTPTYPTPTVLRPHGTASLGPLTGDPHAAEQSAADCASSPRISKLLAQPRSRGRPVDEREHHDRNRSELERRRRERDQSGRHRSQLGRRNMHHPSRAKRNVRRARWGRVQTSRSDRVHFVIVQT